MAERTSAYWQGRFKQMEDAQHDTSIQKMQGIQEQFDRSLAAISGKINAWYQRLADNNGVSMQEARKMLDAWELKEFQWNVEEYTKHAEENEISGAWAKQLENASARVHISRLEALKIETQQEVEKLYGNCTDAIDRHIRDAYTTDFYHTAFEVQKGIGVGTSMNRLDPETVEKIVSKPWAVDGKNFSDRLWENKTKLINNMHNSLSRMCITGEAPDRAIAEISKQMGVSKAQAGRVVMTESAVFANKARQDCMEALDVEQFEVVETLDNHTCELCGGMDGKHFRMTDFEIGVTAPPFHPNCRGCTCPYFDDEFDSVGERAARGEDGKTYYVPADTTYEEWNKLFVDGDVEKGISGKYSQKTQDNNVDIDFVKSNKYRKKFEALDEGENTQKSIWQRARDILVHRNGTNKEDMYLISSVDGNIKGKSVAAKEDNIVEYNKSLREAVESEPRGTLISIHNHGTNLPPTGADFASAGYRGYKKGIVVCHNGDIYVYEVGDKPFSQRLFDDTVEKYRKSGYNKGVEANIKALEQFERDYGIKWRKL